MKYKEIFRIVAMAVLLSLLVMALPASPALAAEEIHLDPDEGEIDDRIDIEGEGFEESYYNSETDYYDSYVDIYFSSEEADEGDDIDDDVENYEHVKSGVYVDDYGEFDTYFYVPDELTDGDEDEVVSSGTYYVYVTYEDDDNIEAVAELTVIAAEIELDPDEGPVGTMVGISGTGFTDDEEITVEYDGDEMDINSGDDETDSDGEFACTIIIPESTAEGHTITVTDESDVEAEAEFTVEPEIRVTTDGGAPGDTVNVEGTGFAEDVDVTIEFDGDEVAEDESNDDGSFTVTFTLPAKGPGTYEIRAEDEDGNEDEVGFDITLDINLSRTTGNVGSEVTVSGSGFTPNAMVTVTYASGPVVVATTTADGTGKFSATFTVPKSKYGQHTITASDSDGRTVTTTFTMESTPPQAPLPLIPQEGTKANSQAYFDWGNVTDPSGVTYTLQIAADESFTEIVLGKTELAESEYTLSEEEKLEPTSNEVSYYWRVRAVDDAENASGWTTPGSFYVKSTLFKGWVLYTVIGLSVVLLLLIISLLRRRTAHY